MSNRPLLVLVALLLFLLGMAAAFLLDGRRADASEADKAKAGSVAKKPVAKKPVAGVRYDKDGHPEGLHRYIRWSQKLGQGAQPEGEIAFKNLAALGFRTILSVDGSLPDVEAAKKHGLRYVHVPIGYDGITEPQALRIVKAGRLTKDPVFVHCHHGRHRGPAAAMLIHISEDGSSNEAAIKGLQASGTSKKYTGLWRDVGAFLTPTKEALATVSGDLPSRVVPAGLQASMVDTSHRWEFLVLSSKSKWKQPEGHPDVDPAHEARMLWELLREMGRTDKESRAKGEIFLKYLKASEDEAILLEKAIRAGDAKEADARFKAVKGLCNDCHRDYRN